MTPKNHNNLQEINLMDICHMPDKDLKIAILKNSVTRKHRKIIQQNQENKTGTK